MANWTHFYAHDFTTADWPEVQTPALNLYGKNAIPLFWYSPFAGSDTCTRTLALSDGDNLAVPGLVTTRTAGLKLARQRQSFFARTLPAELEPHYEAWLKVLEQSGAGYFQLDPCELALLLEPTEIEKWLSEALLAFEGDVSGMLAMFDNPGLEYDEAARRVTRFDSAAMPFVLFGANWE